MTWVARSDISTGNTSCISHVIKSNDIVFAVTAPQPPHVVQASSACPLPGYDPGTAFEFLKKHGLAVRAIGMLLQHPAAHCAVLQLYTPVQGVEHAVRMHSLAQFVSCACNTRTWNACC